MTHSPSDRPDRLDRAPDLNANRERDGDTISPLPGELGIPSVGARRQASMSKKSLLALALLVGSLVAAGTFTVQRVSVSGKKVDEPEPPLARDQPAAATAQRRKLEMPSAPAASAELALAPRIPALIPTPDELAEPIGVRRTRSEASAAGGSKGGAPEDAPVLLVTTRPGGLPAAGPAARRGDAPRLPAEATLPPEATDPSESNNPMAATSRNLQDYQRQLQSLLDNLTQAGALASGQAPGAIAEQTPSNALLSGPPSAGTTALGGARGSIGPGGLFGGQLQRSETPRVMASMLGNRSLTLAKGTAFTCALKTKVISASSGLVGCQVQRNVFSDDGRVLLIERGSHLDGEYRITSVRPGTVRIPVLWTRIRTPLGVLVDIDSPGTGQLGESGIDGAVDNRWGERIGAAMLLSLIDDSVQMVIQKQAAAANSAGQSDTIVLPSTTANSSKLAEKVLDSTINIPPLLYQNQGGIVGIYVARDVDFSSVYELRPTDLDPVHAPARNSALNPPLPPTRKELQ